jgi:hypothetical protein
MPHQAMLPEALSVVCDHDDHRLIVPACFTQSIEQEADSSNT